MATRQTKLTMPEIKHRTSIRNVECDNDIEVKENSLVGSNRELNDNYLRELSGNNTTGEHNDCNNFIVDKKWITQRKKKRDNDLLLQNNFTPLKFQPVLEDINVNDVNDYAYDDGDNDSVAHVRPVVTKPNRQSDVFINEYPERDTTEY